VSDCVPYIPAGYRCSPTQIGRLWTNPEEPCGHRGRLERWIDEAYEVVTSSLGSPMTRSIHVCCYHDNEQARRSLDRQISSSMALAPFSSSTAGLVVVQSESANPANGDARRMRRIVAHELAHLWIPEAMSSQKTLGDGNRDLRVSSWLNEGIAESVGLAASEGAAKAVACRERFHGLREPIRFGELSEILDGLDSDRRSWVFDVVVGCVQQLTRSFDLGRIAGSIGTVEQFLRPDAICSVDAIHRACRALAGHPLLPKSSA